MKKINIAFVEEEEMTKLNKQYRNIESSTDVLSFNIDDEVLGEVYICPSYIQEAYRDEQFVKEVYRDIIHGILHLIGYDHEKKFDEKEYSDVKMYAVQEKILNLLDI